MPLTHADIHDIVSYHKPNEDAVRRIANIRVAAEVFMHAICQNTPVCADQSASLRKAREAMMTANAAIVLNGKV